MILIINTSLSDKVTIALCKEKSCQKVNNPLTQGKTENLLPAINHLLTNNNATLGRLKGIAVHQGPGPYTGIRVGVTIANTLAWALNIPVIGFTGKRSPAAVAARVRSYANQSPHFQKPIQPIYL